MPPAPTQAKLPVTPSPQSGAFVTTDEHSDMSYHLESALHVSIPSGVTHSMVEVVFQLLKYLTPFLALHCIRTGGGPDLDMLAVC